MISPSDCGPTSKQSTLPESITSGITLAMINTAMNRLAMGSNPVQPVYFMRMVEMMTPTLPAHCQYRLRGSCLIAYLVYPRSSATDLTIVEERAGTHRHDMQENTSHVVRVRVVVVMVVIVVMTVIVVRMLIVIMIVMVMMVIVVVGMLLIIMLVM